jgi:parallel beta-helix repeat protein
VHEHPDGMPLGVRGIRRIARPGRRGLLPVGVAAAAYLAVLAPGAHADQIACGQVVTTSTTITNSLAGCAGDGIVIGAGGITVDLGGNTIQGTGIGVGILNNGHDDVTIRNGAVLSFDHGVVLNPGTVRNAVTGLNLAQNEWSAIELNNASGNHVAQNKLSGGDVGLHAINGASDNAVKGNVVGAGAGDSFVVEQGSDRNWFEGNLVETSAGRALRVEGSSNTMVLGNEFQGSSDVGVEMFGAPGSVVQANKLGTGGDAGVLLSHATASVVRFNAFGQSSDAGVILDAMTNSLVKGNALAMAGDAAIVLREGSSDVRVIDNTASHASDSGIFVANGVANTVRGNVLTHNANGIELSGGRQNRVEFNTNQDNLGLGVEVSESVANTVFGNTMDRNLQGGIWVDGGAVSNTIEGNAARGNGGDGIHVFSAGTVVRYNLARNNQGWGIFGAAGVIDGGANGASGNAEPAQCYLIACNDGSNWVAPVRPPEPLDPLELGLPDMSAVGPRTVRALRAGRGRRRARTRTAAVVVCKRRRAVRGRAARKRNRVRAVCKAPYKAKRSSRRVSGRLVRHGKAAARGARRVRGGSRGMVSMLARKRLGGGRYKLVLSYRDGRRHARVTRRTVRLRFLGD